MLIRILCAAAIAGAVSLGCTPTPPPQQLPEPGSSGLTLEPGEGNVIYVGVPDVWVEYPDVADNATDAGPIQGGGSTGGGDCTINPATGQCQ